MKALIYFLLVIGLLSTCKNVEVFKPTCTNIVLEKVDWTYCYLHNKTSPVKCNNKNDTLTLKILKRFESITATITDDCVKGFYNILVDEPYKGTKEDGRTIIFSLLRPYNLPECFKKNMLRVKLSGDLRPYPGLDESCGEAFEITKIEEIP